MTEVTTNFFMVFCENAATSPDGKLNIEGIYNELYAPGFPAKQDRLVLAGVLEWQRDTSGVQPFTVHLIDPIEKPIFTVKGQTDVDARVDDRAPAKTHLILPLDNLVFMNPGQYGIVLELGDDELCGPSLHLLRSSSGNDVSNL